VARLTAPDISDAKAPEPPYSPNPDDGRSLDFPRIDHPEAQMGRFQILLAAAVLMRSLGVSTRFDRAARKWRSSETSVR
jgi:hypothetical protein